MTKDIKYNYYSCYEDREQSFRKSIFNIISRKYAGVSNFWIETFDGILGIEHTLVFISKKPNPRQSYESQIDDVISIAKKHVELNSCSKTRAYFSFSHFTTLKKKERIDLGIQLARVISTTLIRMESTSLNIPIEIEKSELPEIVNSIRLLKIKDDLENYWTCIRAGVVLNHCVELLQNKIDEKAVLYHKYLENCKKIWLLIVAHGTQPSSFIQPDIESLEHLYKSPFGRTYYFEAGFSKLHSLKTEK